jgi:hypothetical protein
VYTTNIPGVLISREAKDLAYTLAHAIDRMLTQTAIAQAKAMEKQVVGPAEIEAAARTVAVDLVALIESARTELHARQEARRAA